MQQRNSEDGSMNRAVKRDLFFSRCLYNIPHGTCIIFLPGTSILFSGLIMMLLVQFDASYKFDEFNNICILFLVIGGCMSIASIVYWLMYCGKHRPAKKRVPETKRVRKTLKPVSNSKSNVELVGVYNITSTVPKSDVTISKSTNSVKYKHKDLGHVNEAMTRDDPTTSSTSFTYDDAIDLAPAST